MKEKKIIMQQATNDLNDPLVLIRFSFLLEIQMSY